MANGIQNVGFQSPGYDYTADLMDIERRKALANAMQSQSMQPIDERKGGRFAVPISPFQGLAKMAQGYTAGVAQRSAQERAQALSNRSQSDYANMVQRGLGQLQGSPMSEDASGNVTAAQGPDPAGAMATFGSHPMGAALMPMAMAAEKRRQALATVMQMGQGGQGAPSAPGGAVGGAGGPLSPQIMAMMLSDDPGLQKLAEAMIESQKGVPQRAGAPVVNPFTGQVIAQAPPAVPPGVGLNMGGPGSVPQAYNVPGAMPAMAAQTGSTAMAQSAGSHAGALPYETQVVQTEGAPRLMTGSQAVQAATGAPPPSPIGVGAGAPQQQQGPQPQPMQPQPMQQPQGQPQGVPGRLPGLPLQDQGASAEQRETGKGLGEYVNSHMQNASKAAVANRYLDNMEIAAQGIKTGKLADAQSTLIQWGQALGLPLPQEAKNAAGDIGALNSMAIKMAGTATRQSDAQPSQIQFLKTLEAMPSTARTPEMFTRIVGYMRDLNNYDIAKMQSLDAWRHDPRHGGSAAGFEAAWPAMAARMPFVWNQTKTQNLKDIAAGGANPQGGGNVVEWSDLGRSTPKR